MKILFQSTNSNTFRATLVGYLYEISQKHRVILLTEEIDSHTKRILGDKSLFPGLEKVIFFESPFYGDILRKNYRLCRILKNVIDGFKPDIVIAPEDFWPAGLYLSRFAKKAGAVMVALQDGFRIAERNKLFLWSCLMNSYTKMPRFLPFFIRLFIVKMKKYLGYFLYHWILPLTAGEMPFLGKTSFVFWDTSPGLRDADYSAVFSKRDYDLCVKDGVSPEKLFILKHPLGREKTKKFFERTYFSENGKKENKKTMTIMWSDEKIGFKNKDYSLISERELRESRVRIVKLISENLVDWKIFIKPHPAVKNISEVKDFFSQVPDNIVIVEPSEPADKYIEMSKVVVGFPPPSTTIFSASKQDPEKIVLSLNLNNEFLGDSYKNFEGIDYIDTEDKLICALDSICHGTYERNKKDTSHFDFLDAGKLIEYIYAQRLS